MKYSTYYLDYLKSDIWKQRRAAKLEEAEFKCAQCSETEYLTVHHLTYKNLGNEASDELIVLCSTHHWIADKLRKLNSKKVHNIQRLLNKPYTKQENKRYKRKMAHRQRKSRLEV